MNMSKKELFLFQWVYMINCNENDNGKVDHINKTYAGLDVDIEANIQI